MAVVSEKTITISDIEQDGFGCVLSKVIVYQLVTKQGCIEKPWWLSNNINCSKPKWTCKGKKMAVITYRFFKLEKRLIVEKREPDEIRLIWRWSPAARWKIEVFSKNWSSLAYWKIIWFCNVNEFKRQHG